LIKKSEQDYFDYTAIPLPESRFFHQAEDKPRIIFLFGKEKYSDRQDIRGKFQ
jgi:hypothetical protein